MDLNLFPEIVIESLLLFFPLDIIKNEILPFFLRYCTICKRKRPCQGFHQECKKIEKDDCVMINSPKSQYFQKHGIVQETFIVYACIDVKGKFCWRKDRPTGAVLYISQEAAKIFISGKNKSIAHFSHTSTSISSTILCKNLTFNHSSDQILRDNFLS